MAWISDTSNIDWILIEHVLDEQVDMRLFVASDGSALRTYKGRRRTVTTDVHEARGLTETAAETICETEKAKTTDDMFVSASSQRANDACAYTVHRVTVMYGAWIKIPF